MTHVFVRALCAGSILLLAACGGAEESAEPTAPKRGAPTSAGPEPATAASVAEKTPEGVREAIAEAAEGDHRSAENVARNDHRHPVRTLTFFGLEADMTVVEVWPGGGWYTEVLAPVLRERGRLVAATFPPDGEPEYRAEGARRYREKIEARPGVYGDVEFISFAPPQHAALGEPGSADMVLLSRHFHNFIRGGIVDAVLAASFEVLRPGGVLAVVQHRAPGDSTSESEQRDGYVRESFVVEAAEEAGFTLEGRSEFNANPDDTADHEYGVWTLPPSLRKCRELEDEAERQACEKRYRAIGESDRMTLRFRKPNAG